MSTRLFATTILLLTAAMSAGCDACSPTPNELPCGEEDCTAYDGGDGDDLAGGDGGADGGPPDGGLAEPDAGSAPDSGPSDAGPTDAGVDAGSNDAGPLDGGIAEPDAGSALDGGTDDGGVPGAWICPPEYYGTDDGCDCGCGVHDPDCGETYTVSDCGYAAPCGNDYALLDPDDLSQCLDGQGTCRNGAECVDACPGTYAECQSRCGPLLEATEVDEFDALLDCYGTCGDGSESTCIWDGCSTRAAACLYPQSGLDSCLNVWTCYAGCADLPCRDACIATGSEGAQAAFWAFAQCLITTCDDADDVSACQTAALDGVCAPYEATCSVN